MMSGREHHIENIMRLAKKANLTTQEARRILKASTGKIHLLDLTEAEAFLVLSTMVSKGSDAVKEWAGELHDRG